MSLTLVTHRRRFLLVCLLVAAPVAAGGQNLADIARKEDARRKAIKKPARVYTNADLGPEMPKSPQPDVPVSPPAGVQSPALPAPAPAPAAGEKEPLKDQAYWSGRISAARAALERSRLFAEALQSRINALTTDFVNRDDPAQRAQIEIERQRSLAELERVKREIAEQTKAIADIEEEARRAGVPPGWLR
jgi:hypothetical protein